VGSAPIHGPVSLGSQLDVVPHSIENGGENAPRRTRLPLETIEHELRDWRVPHEVGPAQHLQVPGDGWLREIENGLEIRDEERSGRQTVQDPQPGGLGDREKQIRG
jgi:hypothetical protein